METAAKDAVELQHQHRPDSVHQLSKKPTSNTKPKERNKACFRCDRFNHTPDECRFKEDTCRFCSKKGHIERACLSKKAPQKNPSKKKKFKPVKTVDEEELLTVSINTVNRSDIISVTPKIEGKYLKMELDTGSAISVIPIRIYKELFHHRPLSVTKTAQKAFQNVKEMITSDIVLTHYDPDLPVKLACDSSSYGLGAVISHVMGNGEERPIAFASRTLNSAEKNYAQIQKEALAIVWGVKKFYCYLFGRKFTLLTDHQPLISIFGPKKGIPATAASRMQRYALFLQGYDYDIEYKSSKSHANCDGLSRLPYSHGEELPDSDSAEIYNLSQIDSLPVCANDVKLETCHDPTLSRVLDFTMNGWTYKPQDEILKPFYMRRHELSVQNGCLMWGIRVIIPVKLRNKMLDELHVGHIGIVKMKELSRSFFWWPKLDSDIEQLARKCSGCQIHQKAPPKASLHPWECPSAPWERIHIDFAGPFLGHMFLIAVDAHSKWPEVHVMNTITASKTIDVLRQIFAQFGAVKQIISDNGRTFTSAEFQNFGKNNGIIHKTSAPWHPATQGLVERFVQTFKQAMKSALTDGGSLNQKITCFLLQYRNAVHATTNESPAKL